MMKFQGFSDIMWLNIKIKEGTQREDISTNVKESS